MLKTNCGVPPLDRDESRLCMMGLNANTVVPNGDTIAGLKYIARRFVGDVARAEELNHREFPSRMRMQVGLARKSARNLRNGPEDRAARLGTTHVPDTHRPSSHPGGDR